MNSTGHCNNIMNGTYVDIGIGYDFGKSPPPSGSYNHWWTQDFGKP
jgi:uncharacterized protein YkwD